MKDVWDKDFHDLIIDKEVTKFNHRTIRKPEDKEKLREELKKRKLP